MKPLLIGQPPGPNTDPTQPLHPLPATSAGGRLAAMMGLEEWEYLMMFDRMNLIYQFPGRHKRDDKFPMLQGKLNAQLVKQLMRNRTLVFLGRNVEAAFNCKIVAPFFEWQEDKQWDYSYVVVPHPSGRSHWYNRPANKALAVAFWQRFLSDYKY